MQSPSMPEPALCQHCSGGEQHAEPQTCGVFQKLSEVQEEIKATTALLADLKRERQKLKEKANYHSDPFIHRLPTEVGSNIFELCLPDNIMTLDLNGDEPITSYTASAPLVLSAVCRRWRAIAHSTPPLWNVLPLICNKTDLDEELAPSHVPLLVREWIDRSGMLPLSINLHSAIDDRVADWRNHLSTLKIMEVLNRCSDRWLHLKYEGPSELISQLFPDGRVLPQLTELQLTVPSRSRCSLQTLSLFDAGVSHLGVATLLDGMPTLQNLHLCFDSDDPAGVPTMFLARLAESSIINGRIEPRYVPSLCSLAIKCMDFQDWTMLPDIFCPHTSQSTEGHRKALKSVTILSWTLRSAQSLCDEDTLKRVLWLRDFAGVNWKIEQERDDSDENEDVIARAIELYQLR